MIVPFTIGHSYESEEHGIRVQRNLLSLSLNKTEVSEVATDPLEGLVREQLPGLDARPSSCDIQTKQGHQSVYIINGGL